GEAGQGGVGAPVEHRPSDVGLDVDQPVRVGVEADQGAGLRQVGLDDPADVDGVGGVPVVLQARALAGGAVDAAAAAGQGDPGDAGDDQDGDGGVEPVGRPRAPDGLRPGAARLLDPLGRRCFTHGVILGAKAGNLLWV